MKRIVASILLLIYSLTTVGATVQLHYCMGKLSGGSLVWAEGKSEECSKCGMEKTENSVSGCCHDENQVLKVKDDQKINYLSLGIYKLPVASPVMSDHTIVVSLANVSGLLPPGNAPPRSSGADICVRNCVFRI